MLQSKQERIWNISPVRVDGVQTSDLVNSEMATLVVKYYFYIHCHIPRNADKGAPIVWIGYTMPWSRSQKCKMKRRLSPYLGDDLRIFVQRAIATSTCWYSMNTIWMNDTAMLYHLFWAPCASRQNEQTTKWKKVLKLLLFCKKKVFLCNFLQTELKYFYNTESKYRSLKKSCFTRKLSHYFRDFLDI